MGLLDSNLYSQQKKYIPKNEFLSQASLLKNQEELEQYTNAVIANNNEVLGAELKAKDPNAYKAWEDYSNYNPSGLNLEQFQEARNNPTKPKSMDIANPLGIAGVLLDKAGLVPDSVKYGLDMSRNRIEGFLKDGYNFLAGNENYQNPHYKEIEKIRVASKYQPNHTTTDRVMQSLVNYATDPIDLATTFVAPANIAKVASVAKGAQYYAPIVKNALYAGVGGGLNSAINPNNYNETKGDVVADIGFNTALGGVLGGVGAGLTNRIFNGKWVAPKSDVMLSDSTPATNIANNAIESNANNVSSNLTTTTNPIYQAILDKQARDLGLNPINTTNTAETIIEPNITTTTNKPFGLMEYYQSLPENNVSYRNIVDSKINAMNPANESFGMLDMARMQDEINNNIRTNANGTNANLATNMPNNTSNLPKQVMGDGFVMGEAGRIQHYSDMPINQTMKNNLGVDFDSIKADFTQLQNTHPELFSNTNAVAKLMQNIKDNPEYFFKNNRLDMQLVGKFLGDNRFAEMGVVTQGNNAGKVGHILETSKGDKRIRSLIKREDKNPLAETATLNTLSNRTDGRNGANALSKDLSNSTTTLAQYQGGLNNTLDTQRKLQVSGFEVKGKSYDPQIELLNLSKAKEAEITKQIPKDIYELEREEGILVAKLDKNKLMDFLANAKQPKQNKQVLAQNIAENIIRSQGGGVPEREMYKVFQQIEFLEQHSKQAHSLQNNGNSTNYSSHSVVSSNIPSQKTKANSLKAEDNLSFESYVKSKGKNVKDLKIKEFRQELENFEKYKAKMQTEKAKATNPHNEKEAKVVNPQNAKEAKLYQKVNDLLERINDLEKKPKRTNIQNQILKGLKENLAYEFNSNPKLKEVMEKYKNDKLLKIRQPQKEQRGIYNVTYNHKKATLIKRDLDNAKEIEAIYAQGYQKTNNRGKEAKHIFLNHAINPQQEGYITQQELLNMGVKMREYLSKHNEPYLYTDKSGNQSLNYEWFDNNGVKFRISTKLPKEVELGGGKTAHSHLTANEIITYFSNRNLKAGETFEFRNPKVQQEHQNHLKEIIQKVNDKTESSLSLKNATQLFKSINKDKENDLLFDRIIESAKQLGVKVEIKNKNKGISTNETGSYDIYKNLATIFNNFENKIHQSEDLLHELIHSTTARAFRASPDLLTPLQKEGVAELRKLYNDMLQANKKLGNGKLPYGLSSLDEFVAELSNPEFRNILKKNQSVFDKIKEAISKIVLGIKNAFRIKGKIYESNQYTRAKNALYKILDNYNPNFTKQWDSKKIQETLENLKSQKELRGIYNVTYNGKMATMIKTDLDSIKEGIIRYAMGDRNKGAKHIIKVHSDSNQMGYVTPQEIINMGKNIREYIKEYKEPLIDRNGARIYEWFNSKGDRFRIVVNNENINSIGAKTNLRITSTYATNDEIITFYSDRNLKLGKTFEFKNPAVKQAYDEKFRILKKIREDRTAKAENDFIKTQDAFRKLGVKFDEKLNATYALLKDRQDTLGARIYNSFYNYATDSNKWWGIYGKSFSNLSGIGAYREKDFLNALEIHKQKITTLGNNLSDLAKLLDTSFTKADLEKLAKYHIGELDEKAISPELKAFADTQREYIKQAGQKLVEYGLLDEKTFKEMGSTYLMREYASKMWDIKKYFRGGSDLGLSEVKHRGETKVVSQSTYEKMKEAGEIGKFIEGKWEMYDSYNGKIHLRRDWSREQRDKWGQIDNYAYNLPRTLDKIYRDIYAYEFLEGLSKNSDIAIPKAKVKEAPQGYSEISGYKFKPLSKFYIKDSVVSSLKGEFKSIDRDMDKALEGVASLVRVWKRFKTVYNTSTHLNNLIGNAQILAFNGEGKALAEYSKILAQTIAKKGVVWDYMDFKKLKAKASLGINVSNEEMQKYNIYSKSFDVALMSKLDDMGIFARSKIGDVSEEIYKKSVVGENKSQSKIGKVWEIATSFDKKLTHIYGAEDSLARFALTKSLIMEGYNLDNAFKIANTILPDYNKPMPNWLKNLDNYGFVPFLRWTYYSTPTLIKSINPLSSTARGTYNAKTQALKTLLLGGLVGGYLADYYTLTGGDTPKGSFAKELPIFKHNGEVTTLRIGSMLPHLSLFELIPFTASRSGEVSVSSEFGDKLDTLGMWGSLWGAFSGKNPQSGMPISRQKGWEQVKDRALYFGGQITPAIIGKSATFIDNRLNEYEPYRKNKIYKQRSLGQDIANLLGVNIKTYNINELRKKLKQED